LPKARTDLQDLLECWVKVQQHFWKGFQMEFGPMMGPRTKWADQQEEIKDVVINVDEDSPCGEWQRVCRVFRNLDGLHREVEVTNGQGKFYVRPISKLIPIVL
jgi:hypothetical protein